jgi:hypothetical protein
VRRDITILLGFLFGFTQLPADAQLPDYHVQFFNEKNGLQSFLMQDLVKDQNGFLWVLHRLKAQRFDGKSMKDFVFEESMYFLFCDDQNNIWASSRSGIFMYNDHQKGFKKIPHDTSGQPAIGKFLKIASYGLVAHSSKCFYVFDSLTRSFKKIISGPLSAIKSMTILSVNTCGDKVFVHGGDTLYRINIRTSEIDKLPGAVDVFSFHALNENKVLVSSFNNYSYWFDFKDHNVTKIDIGKGLGQASSFFLRIYDLYPVSRNEYFITSILGPLLYNDETGHFRKLRLFSDGKPLRSLDLVGNMFMDAQKNIWIIHLYNGLIYFRATEGQVGLLRNAEIEESRSWHNSVRNFAEDEQGNLWLATLNGFAHINLQTGKITPHQPKVNDTTTYSFPSMRGIACRGDYVILGPTNRGLWLYHMKKKIYSRPVFLKNEEGNKTRKKLENDFIDNICKLRSGDFIISSRDGHYFMDGKTFLVTAIRYPGESENGNFAYQDNSGNIWLGNHDEVLAVVVERPELVDVEVGHDVGHRVLGVAQLGEQVAVLVGQPAVDVGDLHAVEGDGERLVARPQLDPGAEEVAAQQRPERRHLEPGRTAGHRRSLGCGPCGQWHGSHAGWGTAGVEHSER